MGDYVYMQGTAKIRPEYVKPLQKFFATADEGPDYELDWAAFKQVEITLPLYSGYYLLEHCNAGRIPHGMPNPTGWPDHFDDIVDEQGVLELSDDGQLAFKCSDRNRNYVMEAFISLVFLWADDYDIRVDRSELSMGFTRGEEHTTIYTPDNTQAVDALLDQVGARHRELLRKAELWKLAPITDTEKQQMRNLGISEAFLESLDGPSQNVVDVPNEPQLVATWSKLVNDKLAQMGIPLELFTSSNPRPHESFAEYVVRLGMTRVAPTDPRVQSLESPKLGQWNSLLEHIQAHKLFARGKMGVRQVNRKQRRKMRA